MNKAHSAGQLHYAEHAESDFAFTAMQQGDYVVCFWPSKSYHNPPIRVTVDFEWKSGVSTRNWKSVARKGNINVSYISIIYSSLFGKDWINYYHLIPVFALAR
jgi:emp24/gp25L/p24 family/GOLD